VDVLAVLDANMHCVAKHPEHNVNCALSSPGHHAHFGQAIRGPERGRSYEAAVEIYDEHLLVAWGDEKVTYHHHDLERLRAALEMRTGSPLITPGVSLLRVPHVAEDGYSGNYCFSLSRNPLSPCAPISAG
jgi:hypothetical protein